MPPMSLVVELRALICDLKVPTPEAFGIDRKAWEEKISLMAEQALASGSPGNNPVVPDAEQVQAIYKEIYA
jgi:alcohol dehydrogenase class IV